MHSDLIAKPTDHELLSVMIDHMGGRRCVTYVIRNIIGRKRCSTAWIRAQLRRMQGAGYVAMSDRQDRGGMINWDVTPAGRAVLTEGKDD